ncbi:cation:proton antiporter [Candidatus Endobugula sertula]|uniref:Cation:proton antiporter n=1 Tax=Candidatus Endobugula sertula TaxID=62101 RepID=A0A1D2QU56_9GAMM|nr:cation:proton antiporter [Candidatus Endobugula sertula]
MTEQLVIMVLLSFLVVIAFGIILLKDLLVAVILSGIYSLTAAAIFVVMDAVDVAFTEAAVGAGVSTIFLLGALTLTRRQQKQQKHNNYFALLVVTLTGALLIYGTLDLPGYGDGQSIANQHPQLAQHFLQKSEDEIGIPNVVTSVLASYRGYDTLGETVVVFTAAIGVLSLLGLRRRKREEDPELDAKRQCRQQNEEV